ncbi:MAG TPA: polysaccharide deacetylase family protein [Candidatus Saccharimonadales bacterium]|nr:polysaccharide deacetylase family protein [Candidatus Saccharimonadales bacterium]
MSPTKRVALTFDDGPNPPYTEQILDILKKEGIRAAFFVCGANVKRHPETVKREAKEGHLVGNHTWSHLRLKTYTGMIYDETQQTQKLLEKTIGVKQKIFRSPYFMAPAWVKNRLKNQGFKIYGGIVGSDWVIQNSPETIARNILKKTKDETIIVLHDGQDITEGADRSQTVKALPIIINQLKKQGYQFVPLDQIQNPADAYFSSH